MSGYLIRLWRLFCIIIPVIVVCIAWRTDCLAAIPEDWIEIHQDGSWCGAKCLELICRAFDRPCAFDDILEICDTSKSSNGNLSLADLDRIGKQLGLSTMPVKCSKDWLDNPHLPAITPFHRSKSNTNHFVILVAVDRDRVSIVDPFTPNTVTAISRESYLKTWTRDALLVSPHSELTTQEHWWMIIVLTIDIFIAMFFVALVLFVCWSKRKKGICQVALFIAVACSGCGKTDRGVHFNETQFDGGQVLGGAIMTVAEHTFTFTNKLQHPVTIADVKTSCSCSIPEYSSEPVAPGQTGSIRFRANLIGRFGRFDARAAVTIEGCDDGPFVLVMTHYITKPPVCLPGHLDLDNVRVGKTGKKTAILQIPLGPTESIPGLRVEHENDLFEINVSHQGATQHRLSPTGGGMVRVWKVPVCISVAAKGVAGTRLADVVTFHIADRTPIVLPVSATIVDPRFYADTPILLLGTLHSEQKTRERIVFHTRLTDEKLKLEDFDVTSPSGVLSWLDAHDEHLGTINIWVDASKHHKGRLKGLVTVHYQNHPVYCIQCMGWL